MTDYSQLLRFADSVNCRYILNEPMHSHTTFRIGGACDVMMLPADKTQLVGIIRECRRLNIVHIVIGNGSDMVFSSKGYSGVVIQTSGLNGMTVNGNIITCGCGVNISALCNTALEHSLTGAERLFGIPGTVGGAICMNAGAYGGQIEDILLRCECLDGDEIVTLSVDQLDLSYRHSLVSEKNMTVLSAEFKFSDGRYDDIRDSMNDYMSRRREKQPLEYPSAGSVFLRPEGHYAGALIEQCGFRGFCIGDAQVSEKHCGFIVNKGNATSDDVMELVSVIKDKVKEETDVELQCEIKFIGED